MGKHKRRALNATERGRTSSEKSTTPTLNQVKSGTTNEDAKEEERVLKDTSGGSLSLGILDDGGPNEDDLARSEWEREEERRDKSR